MGRPHVQASEAELIEHLSTGKVTNYEVTLRSYLDGSFINNEKFIKNGVLVLMRPSAAIFGVPDLMRPSAAKWRPGSNAAFGRKMAFQYNNLNVVEETN